MNSIFQTKNKATLLLLSGILLLCIAFMMTACGTGPATKAASVNQGNYAVDFTDCTSGNNDCLMVGSTSEIAYSSNSITDNVLTLEAWIKPKSTSTSFILKHMESRGAALKFAGITKSSTSCDNATPTVFTFTAAHTLVAGDQVTGNTTVAGCGTTLGTTYYVCTVPSTTTLTLDDSSACGSSIGGQAGSATDVSFSAVGKVTPMFEIRRVVATVGGGGATSSQSYTVSGSNIALNAWTHITGILTDDDHSAAAGHPTCTGQDADATDDATHLDIYVDETLAACDDTYGNATDPAVAGGYAEAPISKTISVLPNGSIDEGRIWTVERSAAEIALCDGVELTINGGSCDIGSANLLSYIRFNEGSGHNVSDAAGVFATFGKEYPLGGNVFGAWDTGWTTDTPF